MVSEVVSVVRCGSPWPPNPFGVRTVTARVAVAPLLLPWPPSLDLTRTAYDSGAMLGEFFARRQAWNEAIVLIAGRRCPTVQLDGRVRFIFILRPSMIPRPIPLPSTYIGPRSYLGSSSPTRYLSTSARALRSTPRTSAYCVGLDGFAGGRNLIYSGSRRSRACFDGAGIRQTH